MPNLNRVSLQGNLTKDPELRTTNSGTPVCGVRIASNARRKDPQTGEWSDKPNYISLTIWGNRGETFANHFSKGDAVVVDGRLDWREWQDTNGNKREALEVVVDDWYFPGGSGGGAPKQQQTAGDVPTHIEEPVSGFGGGSTEVDDAIPF